MITADKLSKRFGDRLAVDQLSFSVEKGEIVGFLGPNAAGKTTTMRMLTCYFPPTEGSANVAGYDVYKDAIQVRRNVGYLPEHVPLYTDMTVREYLEFAARAKGIPHVDRKGSVDKAIERCSLESVQDQMVGTISRGFRQRVGLGQAILNEPPVLILDEPTVGLDPAQIREIRALIRELGQKSTVILSTHILSEVSVTCSRVIIIARGRIQAQDSPQNLAARQRQVSPIRVKVEGASPDEVKETLARVSGVKRASIDAAGLRLEADPNQEVRPEIARAVVEKGWDLLEL
ncbi:MAG: ATP-binding cassette domain-containing protein, partial [Candidatus Eremiobacterota bacterium]